MRTKEILVKLLHKRAIIFPNVNDGKYSVILTEESHDNDGFKIDEIPEDSIIIKCDMFPNLKPESPTLFFKGNKSMRRRADYALVSESKKMIMFFELKKDSTNVKKIISQLKGAKCVIDYCEIIAEMFWEEKKIFGGFKCSYYIIRHGMQMKLSTIRIDSSDINKPRKITGSTATFNELL